ncbi:glycogen debranching N-terminal domain-containing protein [Streptomyces hokutonensis]|uniref:glycogen debranching N-terminal domain-containing protein n=1 Tax=Streptomyces hokutonensis TaxID=1306990 RepID=UPI00380D7750
MSESPESTGTPSLQPLLHDVVICVSAPAFAASARDGQLRGLPADGFYDQDRRLVHTLCLLIDDREPEPIGIQILAPETVRFTSVCRYHGDQTDDPTVIVERLRTAGHGETLTIRNVGPVARTLQVEIITATDLAGIADVKSGCSSRPLRSTTTPDADGLSWRSRQGRACLTVDGPRPDVGDGPDGGTLAWPSVRLASGATWQVRLHISGRPSPEPAGHPRAPKGPVPWLEPVVNGNRRLVELVRQGLGDLNALRLVDPTAATEPEGREDNFIAAGCPWYLTLFGRDSIWAARMMLPLGTELARGTLWTLARRQGKVIDYWREEAPGRILHELRPADSRHGRGLHLPSHYYGSVDATPLFVTLLTEAWRWGLADPEVDALLPYAERAMDWVIDACNRDSDGLLRYHPRRGGLLHQSWKDSVDAVQDAEGRHISPPLALCEVQGYAYQAATGMADLLESRHRGKGANTLRSWAEGLRKRFAEVFWITDTGKSATRYIAIAVGPGVEPVSGPASNMGQLLGTGIVGHDDCSAIAAHLVNDDLNSGWGLRSRSASVPGFNPLSYHGGSVWTHDTVIAIQGLSETGCHDAAVVLTDGLLEAAVHFGYRMPELYGGDAKIPNSSVVPLAYPAACRPQGWSAAASVALLSALLGLRPDASAKRLQVRPLPLDRFRPVGFGPLSVDGLHLAGHRISVRISRTGVVEAVEGLPKDWQVE